ncbi:MAG TPA: glycosyltransferase family 39 protein, partial [Caldilineaceae bacterium]|nr:glycosyltransferase family 39 protein [Caldilineaceae bacterium]
MSTFVRSQHPATKPNPPRFRSFFWGVIGLVFALLAQKQLYDGNVGYAALLYGLALVLIVPALHRHFVAPLPVAANAGGQGGWSLLWRIAPGLGAIAVAYLGLRQFEADLERPTLWAWWFYLGSVLLIVLFAWLLDHGGRHTAGKTVDQEQWHGWQIAVAVLIFLVALFMRQWRFDELPFGVWYDEAENGLQALRILNDDSFYPLFVGSIHAPAHYLYLIATLFYYVDVSVQSIRLVSVLMGLATVWAAYLAGRELFGRSLGLAAAYIVAVARWNVNFSRIGMYNASTPLFELLTIAFLLRGIRRGRYLDYAVAGLCLGLGLCFYAAFQIFIVATLAFLALTAILQRGFLRRTWSGILIMITTTVLVIAPVLLFAYSYPEVYFERTKDTSIFADKTPVENIPTWLEETCTRLGAPWNDRCTRVPLLLENARKHLLMFNFRGDPNGRHNLPGEPMLDNVLAALLVLGVALALVRFWRPQPLLLLL